MGQLERAQEQAFLEALGPRPMPRPDPGPIEEFPIIPRPPPSPPRRQRLEVVPFDPGRFAVAGPIPPPPPPRAPAILLPGISSIVPPTPSILSRISGDSTEERLRALNKMREEEIENLLKNLRLSQRSAELNQLINLLERVLRLRRRQRRKKKAK